jgi:hypothetical protein
MFELVDPRTGRRVPAADVREWFARASAATGRDPDAERAFVESRLEMIRTHPTLSDAEKAAAIKEIYERLEPAPEPPPSRPAGREEHDE